MSQASDPFFGLTAATEGPRELTARQAEGLAFAIAAAFAAAVALYFHDRFWWPPDDGAYAHVALRILNGEVLNRDVHDHHLGYINLANALWLWLFGPDLLSLRYPLAVMSFLQACLVFALLRPAGPVLALGASIAMSALAQVQFLNPTAHWYSLFVLVLIVCALSWIPRDARGRLEAIGYLIVTLVLFRQLSGAIVAIGALAFLLAEAPARQPVRNAWTARAAIAVMAVGLAGYLLFKTGLVAFVLFGLGPLGVLYWAARVTAKGPLEISILGARLALGGAAALLPLLAYHISNDSLGSWLDDTVLSALYLTELEFIRAPSFALLSLFGLQQAIAPADMAALLNGIYWFALPLLPLALGAALVHGLFRQGRAGAAFHPLPFLAVFYAAVSAHYQIPVYLYYTTAMTLIGLLALTVRADPRRRAAAAGAAVAVSALALWFHAGQPLSRGLDGIIAGERIPYVYAGGIERAQLWMSAPDARTYGELLDTIARETPADSTILAVPFNPEIYFLSDRRNPTRYFNLAVGLRGEQELQEVLRKLRRNPPLLVFYRPEDKYNTAITERLMDFVRIRYEAMPARGGFEIYRYRPMTTIYTPPSLSPSGQSPQIGTQP